MFCRNCGNEMNEYAVVCVRCGAAKGSGNSYCPYCGNATNPMAAVCLTCGCSLAKPEAAKGQAAAEDDANICWGILGFMIPIAGLILYLVWKDSRPKTAHMAGKWALISFVLGIVLYVFLMVLAVMLSI